jgi:hypothetical protein
MAKTTTAKTVEFLVLWKLERNMLIESKTAAHEVLYNSWQCAALGS